MYSNKNNPVIQCVKGTVRKEITWNERTQRIYVYLHPQLANRKLTILRWAYPSLRANSFKNWLTRHEMISKWIPMIKLLKGEDVINNVENDEAKERFHQFFTGKCSIDIRRYEMRLKETPNVVLIGSNRKMVTLFVNKAKKQDHHAYLKKSAKRLNQAQKTKGLKYQEVHEFVWEEVQRRWKSGLPITKSELLIQCMRKFSAGDFFKKVLDKAGNHSHFYVLLGNGRFSIGKVNSLQTDWSSQLYPGHS